MRSALLKKKGFDITAEAWNVVILTILVVVVMLYTQHNIAKGAEADADNNACKTSVIQNSYARVPGLFGGDWSSGINCPVQEITMSSSDETEIKEQAAEAMYTCWNNFGKGELNIFETEKGQKDVFCAICSEITYTGGAAGKNVDGFMQYLIDNSPPGRQDTYFKEFSGRLPTAAELEQFQAYKEPGAPYHDWSDTINTANKKYAVLFVYTKDTGIWDRWMQGALVFIGTYGLVTQATPLGTVSAMILAGVAGGYAIFKGHNLKSDWRGSVAFLPMVEGNSDGSPMLKDMGCTKLGVKPVTT
jgi:hypothetical protein